MDDCVFCRILAEELPADIVARGPLTRAFRDTNPQAPVHVLVVPVEHVADVTEVGAQHGELLAEMVTTAHQVAAREGAAEGGYRLVLNVGDDAGNTVPHLHLHVLGGRRLTWPPG
ncbi:MAG TPA: histidine triad nucleotide-binding protein [Acidimicrobiales bacterium]|nr:histidine triad nucleotide-binding protein [Acidimicrobiales bacterium]